VRKNSYVIASAGAHNTLITLSHALGHAKADVTQVYAERHQALAAEIMGKIG